MKTVHVGRHIVIEAEAPDVEFARRSFQRAQQLFDQQLVAQQQLEDAKSALELAMERLKKQDAEQGVSDRPLTEEQRNEIAEVRKTYGAKLAQEEILFKSKLQGLADYDARQQLQENYRRDVERLLPCRAARLSQRVDFGPRERPDVAPAPRVPALLVDDFADGLRKAARADAVHRDLGHGVLPLERLAARAVLQHHHDEDDEEHVGDAVEEVDDPHHQLVDAPQRAPLRERQHERLVLPTRNSPRMRAFQILATVQTLLLLAVMSSALQRMRLYQAMFGLTEARFYATALLIWVGLALFWLAFTVLRGRRQSFAFGALVSAFVAVATLSVFDHGFPPSVPTSFMSLASFSFGKNAAIASSSPS